MSGHELFRISVVPGLWSWRQLLSVSDYRRIFELVSHLPSPQFHLIINKIYHQKF